MKKHALTLAILAAPALALADGPTLYGKLNVTLDSVDTDTGVAAPTNNYQLNSNASRIGIKGDAETGVQGLKGLYYAEFGIDVADGDTSTTGTGLTFSQRNIYAGLKGGFGALRLGKIDSPLKESQGKVDQFNDLAGDIQNLLAGETRYNNAIYYSSPKIAEGLTINVAAYPGEGVDIDDADGDQDTTTGVETDLLDTVSASVVWEKGPLYAALAIDQNGSGSGSLDGFVDINGAVAGSPKVADIVRGTVVYKADAFEVGALYENAEDVAQGATGEDNAWLVSGAWKNGNWKLKAQYGVNEGDVTEDEKTLTALGFDYSVGKSTTLIGYWTSVEVDDGAPASIDTETTTIGLGLDQKF